MSGLARSRIARLGVAASVLLLTTFHLLLLALRVVDGTVLDPAVATEWVIGLILLFGLVRLHRQGFSLLQGRTALILWLLVLLLHAVAMAPGDGGSLELRVDRNPLGIIPIGVFIGIVISRLAGLLPSLVLRRWIPAFRGALQYLRQVSLLPPDRLSALVPRAPPA